MPNTVFNDKGEALNFDNGQWKPAPVVSNPEGKRLYFDGATWQPFPESAGAAKVPPETAAPAAGQAPSAPASGGSSPATGATPYASYLFGEKPEPTGFLPWDTLREYPFNVEEAARSGLAMAGHGGRTAAEGDPSGAVGMAAGGANAVLSPLSALFTPLSRPVEEFLAKPLERATGLPHEIGTPAIMALPGVFMGGPKGAARPRGEPPVEPDFANMKDVTPPKPGAPPQIEQPRAQLPAPVAKAPVPSQVPPGAPPVVAPSGQPPAIPPQPPAAAPPAQPPNQPPVPPVGAAPPAGPPNQPPNYGRVNVPGPAGPPPKPTSISDVVLKASDLIISALNPTSRGPLARSAEGTMRETQGLGLRDTEQTRAAFDTMHRLVNSLPPADKYQLFAYVQGRSQGVQLRNPALQPLADAMRDAVQLRERKLAALPSTANMQFRTDYLQQLWEDPARAQQMGFGSAKQGTGGFTRKRTFDTIADGIAAGLRLKTDNPIEMTVNYVTNADRFIALNEAFDTARSPAGGRLIRYARPGAIPQGYAALNGRLGEKLSPQGGKYVAVAPEPWALIWNRFVDKGWHEFPVAGRIYDGVQAASNFAQALMFGFNAYHAATVAVKGMASEVARATQEVAGAGHKAVTGRPGAGKNLERALGSLVEAPFSPVTTALRGRRIRDIYVGKKQGTPEEQEIVDLLTRANMRFVGLDHSGEYKYSPMGSYWDAWRKGALKTQLAAEKALLKHYPLTAPIPMIFRNVRRLLQTMSDPLMKTYVPLMRDAAAYRAMETWLGNNPNATQAQKLQAARDIADDIDNRMGEMVHDNLFWAKAMKQTAQPLMVSFSWTLGEGRGFGGGVWDLRKLARGEYAHRTAFTIGYTIVLATIAAILTKLFTGEDPDEWRDFVAPPTGGTVLQGGRPVGERFQIPGQHKDVFGLWYDWKHELTNKLGPLPKFLADVASGTDWRGDPIAPHDATAIEWMKAYLKLTADSFQPMSMDQQRRVGTKIPWWMGLAGFRNAPWFMQAPEAYESWRLKQMRDADQRKRRHDASDQRTYKGQYDGE